MQIKFLTDAPYSSDCFRIEYGVPGETRDVPDNAALRLIRDGHAVSAEPRKTMDQITADLIAELRVKRAA